MNNELGDFTIGEVLELEEKMKGVDTFIPDTLLGYVWSTYQRINKTTEPQPCGCRSAGGLWIKAVDSIKKFLKENADIR